MKLQNKKAPIPSPGSNILRLKDSDIQHHYCELPKDTFFCESIAHNDQFREAVGFIPIQRLVDGKRKETHVYSITPTSKVATHVAGPIQAPGGGDVTVFGSALSSSGILYLCAFNRNSILALNLNTKTVEFEITNIPAPNDVAIDPSDETILYTAGGTFHYLLGILPFSNPAAGRIYKTVLGNKGKFTTKVVARGLKTLAGIEVMDDGEIWTSQLFNVVSHSKTCRSKKKHTLRWKGDAKNNWVWLSDNVDRFEDNLLICPAFTTVSKANVNLVMGRSFIASGTIFVGQALSAIMQGERLGAALRDPELSLTFSNTFIKRNATPAPVRFFTMDPKTGEAQHYEIDLEQTRARNQPRTIRNEKQKVLGQRHFFNEQVTHMAHLGGSIVCVNFEQPRVLVLDDSIFRQQSEHVMAQAV